MTRDWKPGDVAVATVRGQDGTRIFRTGDKRDLWVSPASGVGLSAVDWHGSAASPPQIEEARPLVVIDPEDRAAVEALRDLLWLAYDEQNSGGIITDRDHGRYAAGNALQTALRRLVEEPKPTEPQGLGAVVEDAEGELWIRVHRDGGPAKWHRAGSGEPYSVWSALPAVRVLSEGVAP